MMAFSLSWAAWSRMASNSAFCSAVLSPFLDGQSMLTTVAIQAARNSRAGGGGTTEQRSYVAACAEIAATEARNGPQRSEAANIGARRLRRFNAPASEASPFLSRGWIIAR